LRATLSPKGEKVDLAPGQKMVLADVAGQGKIVQSGALPEVP
jgi:hypothetical protein